MTLQIMPGSLSDVSRSTGVSLAEAFINCDCLVLVDTSGSMDQRDSRGGKRRYDVACEELANLQCVLPGKIGVVAFSSYSKFCPSGIPEYIGASTNLADALKFLKIADVSGMKFILVSDGLPDDEKAALDVARTFQNHIDVIYAGPESDPSGREFLRHGREFLRHLAASTGGKSVTADRAMEMKESVIFLLGKGER